MSPSYGRSYNTSCWNFFIFFTQTAFLWDHNSQPSTMKVYTTAIAVRLYSTSLFRERTCTCFNFKGLKRLLIWNSPRNVWFFLNIFLFSFDTRRRNFYIFHILIGVSFLMKSFKNIVLNFYFLFIVSKKTRWISMIQIKKSIVSKIRKWSFLVKFDKLFFLCDTSRKKLIIYFWKVCSLILPIYSFQNYSLILYLWNMKRKFGYFEYLAA